ncbi:acid shock protein [Streptomyces longwoodensis]|uniref:acid shock protein n=1 Tax=Streptomyces longwoodensis TaxID=68231 RepID=UPI00340245C2
MLIYAFRDARGVWYGDPDAAIHGLRPKRGVLTLPPTAPGQDQGLFDGQQVQVLYAACDVEASQTSYRLDDGHSIVATCHVHELLSPAYQRVLTAPAAARNAATVRLEVSDSDRRYSLHADRLADGRVEITVVACTPDGVIRGELTGELDTADLAEVGRLIATVPTASATKAAPPVTARAPAKATRHGQRWTPETIAYLKEHHRAGKSPAQLAEELGRSEKSIRWKLHALRLAPYPSDLVPEPRTPAEPEVPKAYSVESKRQLHPNAYKPWDPEDEQRLAERCTQGASLSELSQEFGRNEGAIASRLLKIQAEGPAADDAWDYGG